MRTELWTFALVGAGGFVGSALRFGVSGMVHNWLGIVTFPYGTLTVNALGCFLIGLLAGVGEARQLLAPELRLFLLVGLLGGFTTFSTFSLECLAMVRGGEPVRAVANVLIQILICLTAVGIGDFLGRTR